MADVVNTPDVAQQFFNRDGKPLVNGKLAFFENNTDIPASVYTAGGSVALGNEITLDSSGFAETQFALEAGKEYTVKAFDSDTVLIWTRNNVFGGGAGGVSGDFVPMTGTSIGDPIVGSLVLQDTPGAVLDVRNTVSKTGSVLMDTFGGQTSFSRNGLDIQMVNTRGEYLYNKARIQNTQNGFPGYPDYAELSILDLKLHRELDDNGSRKEKSLNLSIGSTIYNTIESKGANLNVNCDKAFMVQAFGVVNLMGHAEGTTPSIELNPTTDGVVYVGNNGSLVTKRFGIGTSLNNKEVNGIWTSSSTGTMTDDQLITAKAAYDMAQGDSIKCTDTIPYCCIEGTFSLAANTAYALAFVPTQDVKINKIRLYGTFPAGQYRAAIYISNALHSYSTTSTVVSTTTNTVVMDVPDTTIPMNGGCWLAFCGNAASTIRGKSGGLNNFSRRQSISPWNWPATPTDYGTAMTDVAYYQIWYE